MSAYDKYLGRPYIAGSQDCYALVREYLQDVYDIRIPNFARPNAFWEDPHLQLYEMHADYGFQLIFDVKLRPGDVLLMPLMTVRESHSAIIVENNQVLHHLPNQLSCVDPLPKWLRRATRILRHPETSRMGKEKVHIHEVVDAEILRDPKFQEALDQVLGSERRGDRNDQPEATDSETEEQV